MDIYYAQPILNSHRHAKRIEVSFDAVHPTDQELFAKAKEDLTKLKLECNLEKLAIPQITVDLGRERSFAPPSPSRNFEFVQAVLEHCGDVSPELIKRIETCAAELEAKSLYVLPKDYRPMTNMGPITAELAKALSTGPCQRRELKKQAGKPGAGSEHTHGKESKRQAEDFEHSWSMELLYGEYVQLICSMRAEGPFILYLTKWAEVDGRRIELGSMYLPFLYEQRAIH